MNVSMEIYPQNYDSAVICLLSLSPAVDHRLVHSIQVP